MSFEYSAKEILDEAKKGGYAIGAFNAANIEILKGIVESAVELSSPVIIEASSGEVNFFGVKNLADVVHNFRKDYKVPILLNLDHSHDESIAYEAIECGYDLIHFDGGEMNYNDNVAIVSRIVKRAHAKGLLVEGEIDHIQGSSELHDENVEKVQSLGQYTDPDQAADFVSQTGVDTLASFIGNVHGVYKNPPVLDIDRLKQIADKVNIFLSLHGGSGIPDNQVKAAISSGIVKVNVNTEMRIAYKTALLKSLQTSDELAIYKLAPPAIEAVQSVVEKKIQLFGSGGKI